MGRAPCCDKANVKKGPWSPEEDSKLKDFIEKHGTGGNWIALPQKAGLKRCGKSCRLRWLNYLRPNIKHGEFSDEEDRIICTLFASIGSRWSIIAAQLPGRTDNDIKNYWNTKLKKKLMASMIPLINHRKPPPYPPPPPPPLQPPHSQQVLPYHNPSNLMNNNYYNPCLSSVTQESLLFNPTMQQCLYPQVKESSMLVFGGDQASCSSSDGSCSQISISCHGKEIKQEDGGFRQGYNFSNGFQEDQKFMLEFGNHNHNMSSTWNDEKPNIGYFGSTTTTTAAAATTTTLEYEIEEVKQLIGNSNIGCDSSNSFFFNDENKTQERSMYYY